MATKLVKTIRLDSADNNQSGSVNSSTYGYAKNSSNSVSGGVKFNAANYSNITAIYLQCQLWHSGGTTAYIELFDMSGGGSGSAITGTEVSTTNTSTSTLTTSSDLSSVLTGSYDLAYKIKGDGTSTALSGLVQLVVVCSGTSYSALETCITLTSGVDSSSNSTSYFDTTTSSKQFGKRFVYDSSLFDGTISIYLEQSVMGSTVGDPGTAIAYAKLFDVTAGADVASSEVTVNYGQNDVLVGRSSAISLTSGHVYAVYFKYSSTFARKPNAVRCNLIVNQTGTITQTADYISVTTNSSRSSSSYGTSSGAGYSYNPSIYNATDSYYSEGNILAASSQTGFYSLKNITDNATITNSEVSTTVSANYDRQLSSSLSMPATSKVINGQSKSSSASTVRAFGDLLVTSSWINRSSDYPDTSSITTTGFSSSVISMAVSMPASVSSGDLLIALVEVRNSGTWTKPTGWNDISTLSQTGGGGGVGKLNGFYKIADGTEGGTTPTWTAGTGTSAIWQVLQIVNWDGSTAPEAATTSGDVSSADPPSLSPSWGTADNLWIAVAGNTANGTGTNFTAAPTGYTSFRNDSASSGGSLIDIATAVNYTSAASEDPGTFTTVSNRFWAAATMAVKPSGGGGGGGTNYTQECDETLTITDTRTNSVGKVLRQVITTTPTFLRATTKSAFTETITVTPTYKNQTQKPLSESITITNPTVITKIVGKTFSESSTITDTFIRQTTKVLTETITLVQGYLNQTTKILSESITTTDTFAKSLIQTLLLSETLTITSTLSRQATKVLSETITLGNTLIKQITYILTESITITATVLKKPSRALTESIIITSVFIRSSTKVLHETLTLTASLIDQLSRSLTETLTISDSVSHLKTMFSTLTETLTIVPSFIRQTSKTFTETLTFLDTLLRQATKVLTDTFTLTDTMQETKGNKIFSETLTITDTIANQTSKTLSEVITIIDTQIRTISKTLSDTITLTASSINQGIKVLSETVTLTDTFTTKILGKFFTETITVVEKYISYHNGVRGLWGKVTKTIGSWTQDAKSSGLWTKKKKPPYPSS